MPCYSRIATKLREFSALEEAARKLSVKLDKHSPNRFTLSTTLARVTLSRRTDTDDFAIEVATARGDYYAEIVQPLTMEYGKVLLKKWAKRNNYVVSAGSETGDYVLSQY
jgi:hypothetical protein